MITLLCNYSSWFININESSFLLPDLNECFRQTILVWAPACFLGLLFPIFTFQIWRLPKQFNFKPLPFTNLLIIKYVITIILFINAVLLFVKAFFDKYETNLSADYSFNNNKSFVYKLYPFINAMSMIVMFYCIRVSQVSGLITSGILHLTWILYAVFSISNFFDWNFNSSDAFSLRTIFNAIWVVGVWIQTIIFCFADIRHIDDQINFEKSPEQSKSFINRQLYWWFNNLPINGAKKDLVMEDLFKLSYGSRSSTLVPLWEYFWDPKIKKYKETKKKLLAEGVTESLLKNENAGSNKNTSCSKKSYVKTLNPPSVIFNLFQMFKWELISSGMIKAFADVLQFLNPFLLKKLLEFVSHPEAPLWYGITCAILMFVSAEIRSIAVNYYFNIMFRMGTKIQTILTSAVYKKTLCLSNAARRNRTSGEIVNLMAIDVERFQIITNYIQQYWSSPFQITLALVFKFFILTF